MADSNEWRRCARGESGEVRVCQEGGKNRVCQFHAGGQRFELGRMAAQRRAHLGIGGAKIAVLLVWQGMVAQRVNGDMRNLVHHAASLHEEQGE